MGLMGDGDRWVLGSCDRRSGSGSGSVISTLPLGYHANGERARNELFSLRQPTLKTVQGRAGKDITVQVIPHWYCSWEFLYSSVEVRMVRNLWGWLVRVQLSAGSTWVGGTATSFLTTLNIKVSRRFCHRSSRVLQPSWVSMAVTLLLGLWFPTMNLAALQLTRLILLMSLA